MTSVRIVVDVAGILTAVVSLLVAWRALHRVGRLERALIRVENEIRRGIEAL